MIVEGVEALVQVTMNRHASVLNCHHRDSFGEASDQSFRGFTSKFEFYTRNTVPSIYIRTLHPGSCGSPKRETTETGH
jgi:hypothetical protein